jgi:hypothetical protein
MRHVPYWWDVCAVPPVLDTAVTSVDRTGTAAVPMSGPQSTVVLEGQSCAYGIRYVIGALFRVSFRFNTLRSFLV